MKNISLNYIRMCEGAKEIQTIWKPETGEYYIWFDKRFQEIRQDIWSEEGNENRKGYEQDFIWLPRLNQLIKHFTDFINPMEVINNIKGVITLKDNEAYFKGLETMEQLILAVYMKTEFNKLWNNGNQTWMEDWRQ